MRFNINEWVDPSDYELIPEPVQPKPQLLFDWSTTTRALKTYNPTTKVSYKAKETFAFTMSSFADEVMEYLLETKRHKFVKMIHICDAFSHLNEPIGSFKLMRSKAVSLKRIMAKYRSLYKFEISYNASRVFACMLISLMVDIAKGIHMNHNPDRKIIQFYDVHNVTDCIVYQRTYTQNHAFSRSVHAMMRVRHQNGRF